MNLKTWADQPDNRLVLKILIGIAVVLTLVGTMIAVLYDSPLESGLVIAMQHQADRFVYDQITHEEYRTDRYTDWENRTVTDKEGNRTTERVKVEKSRRVYDHSDFEIREFHDGEDFIILIEGPSKKFKGKMRTQQIWVPQYTYQRLGIEKPYSFEKGVDAYHDSNNETRQADFRHRIPFNLVAWLSEYRKVHNPDEIILEQK